jgi:lia operon protein LiaG
MKKVLGLMCMGIGVLLLLVTLMQSKIGEWVFQSRTEVRTLEVQGVETLQIEAEYVDLRLVPERRKDIRVEMETSKWHESIGVQQSGSVLHMAITSSLADFFSHHGKSIVVRLPQDQLTRLDLRLISGNVILASPNDRHRPTWDQVRLEIGTGRTRVENVHASRFSYQCSAGQLVAEGLQTRQATFKVESGQVKLDRFAGGFHASISLGHLKARIDRLTGPIQMEIRAGEGSIDLPQDADFRLEARIERGSIKSDFPGLRADIRGEDALKGTVGSGQFPVKLKVSSGHIDLR